MKRRAIKQQPATTAPTRIYGRNPEIVEFLKQTFPDAEVLTRADVQKVLDAAEARREAERLMREADALEAETNDMLRAGTLAINADTTRLGKLQ